MVMVADRGYASELETTLYDMPPAPNPEDGPEIVNQDALLLAFHGQPWPVAILIARRPPEDGNAAPTGFVLYVQPLFPC